MIESGLLGEVQAMTSPYGTVGLDDPSRHRQSAMLLESSQSASCVPHDRRRDGPLETRSACGALRWVEQLGCDEG